MATAVKERPILFSADMVRAILDGRKSQTRRILTVKHGRRLGLDTVGDELVTPDGPYWNGKFHCGTPPWSPYGKPGDRLWVREAFGDRADYAAIGKAMTNRFYYAADGKKSGWKYKPSIHMPRKASRITLEIVDVRVERSEETREWEWVIDFTVIKG